MTPGEQQPEDAVSSDCSSGCQSGWTAYLDHSVSCAAAPHPSPFCSKDGGRDEEEEDMSMVSDASSGPPQFHETEEEEEEEDDGAGNCKRRRIEAEHNKEEDSSLLDDTASSHRLTNSMTTFCGDEDGDDDDAKRIEFSCGFSATHFKRKLQSSAPIKPNPARPVAKKESRKKIR